MPADLPMPFGIGGELDVEECGLFVGFDAFMDVRIKNFGELLCKVEIPFVHYLGVLELSHFVWLYQQEKKRYFTAEMFNKYFSNENATKIGIETGILVEYEKDEYRLLVERYFTSEYRNY
jgi:hypothetical protein